MNRLALFIATAALITLGLTMWALAGATLVLAAACQLAEGASC